jgi:hypothetical protein
MGMNKAKADWIVMMVKGMGNMPTRRDEDDSHPYRRRTAINLQRHCFEGDGGSLGLEYGEREVCL